MTLVEREKWYIRKWRPIAMRGDTIAMMNVAAAYRLLGKFRRSFIWNKKAADLGDADALLEVGYCFQHGVGTKRNARSAQRAYRAAIAGKELRDITPISREEAMYSLAVLLLSSRSQTALQEAKRLLRRANVDQDYPQAALLLENIAAADRDICVCRRGLRWQLAIAHCPVHRGRSSRSYSNHRSLRGALWRTLSERSKLKFYRYHRRRERVWQSG